MWNRAHLQREVASELYLSTTTHQTWKTSFFARFSRVAHPQCLKRAPLPLQLLLLLHQSLWVHRVQQASRVQKVNLNHWGLTAATTDWNSDSVRWQFTTLNLTFPLFYLAVSTLYMCMSLSNSWICTYSIIWKYCVWLFSKLSCQTTTWYSNFFFLCLCQNFTCSFVFNN